ncbi:hypothetical protein, partial [Escherichia coli]|uniref:hypothetical protein n=1 Tax=Escherichia coli TaxID=562 RepID=UPI0022B17225
MVKHPAPHKEAVVTARYGLYITQLILLTTFFIPVSYTHLTLKKKKHNSIDTTKSIVKHTG